MEDSLAVSNVSHRNSIIRLRADKIQDPDLAYTAGLGFATVGK